MVRVRLLKNLTPDPVLDPKATWRFEVINSKVKVPSVETTYWCHIVKLPERMKDKHQIVQVFMFRWRVYRKISVVCC